MAEAGRAKLIDLSIARAAGPARSPAWVPGATWRPSRRAAAGSASPRDVWGIGVVLWEAACGDTPFADESVEHPQLVHRAPPLRSQRRLPATLANGVDRCLEPDPAARPSLAELRELLEPVAGARG